MSNSSAIAKLTNWKPPATLNHASAYYQALCRAGDAVNAVTHWRVANDADVIGDWAEALFFLAGNIAETTRTIKPVSVDDIDAKRTILTDWAERCGTPTAERLQTLGTLAVEELDARRAKKPA